MRDFSDKPLHIGRFEGPLHTYLATILRILDKDYRCQPDKEWLDGQIARISRALDFGESAEMCADMIAKFWVGHVRSRREKSPIELAVRHVGL